MSPEKLADAGFPVSANAHARLSTFVAALLDENSRHNLTAIREESAVWRLHICDALAHRPLIESRGASRLIDLGSGGGLPGLPLACVIEPLHVTLLDATRKKIDATSRIAATVGIADRVNGVWGRAEEIAHDPAHRERYDVLTARAVAELPELIELSAAFIRVGGACLFAKSSAGANRESPEALPVAAACGLRQVRNTNYRLPGEAEDRIIVAYEKVSPTPRDLPRRIGEVGKPLRQERRTRT